jgi:membrane protein
MGCTPRNWGNEVSVKQRLKALPGVNTALLIHERVGEIRGGQLAGTIALNIFLSIFPLIVSVIAIVGFVSDGNPDFTDDLIDNLGVTGAAEEAMRDTITNAEDSRRAASIIGVIGLLWSGLALVGNLSQVINASWQVVSRGLRDKLGGIFWLLGAGLLFVASFALSSLIDDLPGFLAPLNLLIGFGIGFGLFLWTFWFLGNAKPPVRSLVPGALLCAVGFEILKLIGSVVVPRLVASSSALYGSLGVVFALIAWLIIFGRLLVYGTVFNVIDHEATHGTVTVEIEAPNLPDEGEPVRADRSGTVIDRAEPENPG